MKRIARQVFLCALLATLALPVVTNAQFTCTTNADRTVLAIEVGTPADVPTQYLYKATTGCSEMPLCTNSVGDQWTPPELRGLPLARHIHFAEHTHCPPMPSASMVTNEQAAIQGLRWLRDSQNKDGSWGTTNDLDAATGVAVAAFLGHRDTAISKEFGETARRGVEFLVADMLSPDTLARKGRSPAYGHAISTSTLCEGFALMQHPSLKDAGEAGLAVIVAGQRDSGMWDASYKKADGADDLEATVWQVLALRSGLTAGLKTNAVRECLGRVSVASERLLATKPDVGTSLGAVLMLQMCGQGRSPACLTALEGLATLVPDWEDPSCKDPSFRWCLATQAFSWDSHWEGRENWLRWSRLLGPMLVAREVGTKDVQGKAAGYWEAPHGGEGFGRVYSTALSVQMLNACLTRPRLHFLPEELATQQDARDTGVDDIRVKIR